MAQRRFGIAISYYGGMSWAMARLERQAVAADVPLLGVRGAAYPEMARAEQFRQAMLGDFDVLVMLDANVQADLGDLTELVKRAETYGFAAIDQCDARPLACSAVRLDVLRAMAAEESGARGEQTVKSLWNGEEIMSAPLASPWKPNGQPIISGLYATEGQAFVKRASAVTDLWTSSASAGVAIPELTIRGRVKVGIESTEPGGQFAVCVASFGALDHDQQRSLAALEAAGMMTAVIHDCPWIDMARSWLAEQALAAGRGAFFVDHDILFDPRDVIALCAEALERNCVIGAGYSMRKPGRHMIGAIDVRNHERTRFFEGGSVVPAFYTGMGFTAVPASVLESIDVPSLHSSPELEPMVGESTGPRKIGLGPLRPWFGLDCSTGYYAGEDVSFCNRVHDLDISIAGGDWVLRHSGRKARVFMDTRIRVGHRGVYDFHLEDVGVIVPLKKQLDMVAFEKRAEAAEFIRLASSEESVSALPFPEDTARPLERESLEKESLEAVEAVAE